MVVHVIITRMWIRLRVMSVQNITGLVQMGAALATDVASCCARLVELARVKDAIVLISVICAFCPIALARLASTQPLNFQAAQRR